MDSSAFEVKDNVTAEESKRRKLTGTSLQICCSSDPVMKRIEACYTSIPYQCLTIISIMEMCR